MPWSTSDSLASPRARSTAPVALIAVRGAEGAAATAAEAALGLAGTHLLAAGCGLPPTWRRGDRFEDALPGAAAASLDGPLAVADMRATPRLRGGAAVAALGAVACVAAALRGRDGAVFGALLRLRQAPAGVERRGARDARTTSPPSPRTSTSARSTCASAERCATSRPRSRRAPTRRSCTRSSRPRSHAPSAPTPARSSATRTSATRASIGSWGRDGVEPLPLDGLLSLEAGGIAAALRGGQPARADGDLRHRPFRHRVGAPIGGGQHVWGFVAALADVPFPPGVENRVADFAELVAAALANAEARGALAAQATTDPLTGLANQRAFQERLRGEAERARRHGRNLGLALIDLDGFKFVNDTWGHQAGDDVLVTIARRAASTDPRRRAAGAARRRRARAAAAGERRRRHRRGRRADPPARLARADRRRRPRLDLGRRLRPRARRRRRGDVPQRRRRALLREGAGARLRRPLPAGAGRAARPGAARRARRAQAGAAGDRRARARRRREGPRRRAPLRARRRAGGAARARLRLAAAAAGAAARGCVAARRRQDRRVGGDPPREPSRPTPSGRSCASTRGSARRSRPRC